MAMVLVDVMCYQVCCRAVVAFAAGQGSGAAELQRRGEQHQSQQILHGVWVSQQAAC